MEEIIFMCNKNNTFEKNLDISHKPEPLILFNKDNNIWNSKYFRIPNIQLLNDGTILTFSDIRYNGPDDHAYIDIASARSTDFERHGAMI